MVITYTNGTDTHRMRQHVRAFDATGTYLAPGAGTPTTVMADFTGLATKLAALYPATWTFSLTSLFQNNGDGTFTEIFGWTAPAPIVGTEAGGSYTDQDRALEAIFNFRDGHGGRARCVLIATGFVGPVSIPLTVGGAGAGTAPQQLVDYLTNPVKTNIVSHGGHQSQSPARVTVSINRRLRRHYGFS